MKRNNYRKEFLISDHESMIENINHISDDLLKLKWYFLATIAAFGFSYKFILDIYYNSYIAIVITLVTIIINLILWYLSEYAISHGFLFRYIQTKAASIEKIFQFPNRLIRDPTDKESITDGEGFLIFDHKIPDQFVPTYWASLIMIFINTICGIYFIIYFDNLLLRIILCVSATYMVMTILIVKLYFYYIYKMNQFYGGICGFNIKIKYHCHEKNFFSSELNSFFITIFKLFLPLILIAILLFRFFSPCTEGTR